MKEQKLMRVLSNLAGMKFFQGGWTKVEEKMVDGEKMYLVYLTKEQYEKMEGSEYDPWDLD